MKTGAQKWVIQRVKKRGWVGVGEVGWGEGNGFVMDEVADVVEGHDDHDGSAQGVDGLKTR
jgi:hypothetical protein